MADEITVSLMIEKLEALKHSGKIKDTRLLNQVNDSISNLRKCQQDLENDRVTPLTTDDRKIKLLGAVYHAEDAIDTFLASTTLQNQKFLINFPSSTLLKSEQRLRSKLQNFVKHITECINMEPNHVRHNQVQPSKNKGIVTGNDEADKNLYEGALESNISDVPQEQPQLQDLSDDQLYEDYASDLETTVNKLAESILHDISSLLLLSMASRLKAEGSLEMSVLGKTYSIIKEQFDFCGCHSASTVDEAKKCVMDQLVQEMKYGMKMEEKMISRFLSNKKYLLVFYNIQTHEGWESLSSVLPNSDGSRIILSFHGINAAPDIHDARRLGTVFGTELVLPSTLSEDTCVYSDEETDIVGLKNEIQKLHHLICRRYQLYFMILVVGVAGSGKTTLVKAVYNHSHMKVKFEKRAWVTVSKVFEERSLLLQILKQVTEVKDEEKLSIQELRTKLRNNFSKKRCLVVLDDVRTPDTWEKLKLVFPVRLSNGSRLILTIRDRDVNIAQNIEISKYSIYNLRRLNEDESWKLFLEKLKPEMLNKSELMELKEKILQKCKGLPLAICMLGGLLSIKESTYDAWSKVIESTQQEKEEGRVSEQTAEGEPENQRVSHNHTQQGEIEEVKSAGKEEKQIANVSSGNSPNEYAWLDVFVASVYQELPSTVRACLFFLCVFPRSEPILVRRVVQLWIAEGLVKPSADENQDVVYKYLEQLEQTNMIHVERRRFDGRPKTCSVQGILYDLLCQNAESTGFFHVHFNSDSKSESTKRSSYRGAENLDSQKNPPTDPESRSPSKFRIRRVSDQVDIQKNHLLLDERVQQLRSYISFNKVEGDKPSAEVGTFLKSLTTKRGFGLLTLLDLEGVYKPELPPEILRMLPLLRYVGLRRTFLDKIPESVGDIPYLETLDVKHTNIRALPSSICNAKKLRNLYLNGIDFEKSRKICGSFLTELQTLSGLRLGKNSGTIEWLVKLGGLRKLELTCHKESIKDITSWLSSLKSLHSLRLRSVDDNIKSSDLQWISMNKNEMLTEMYLVGVLPEKISISIEQLPSKLRVLTLSLSNLSEDPMPVLGKLENLTILRLYAKSYSGKKLNCEPGGFPGLQILKLWMLLNLREWEIEEGAMRELRDVEIRYCPVLQTPYDLEKSESLKKLTLTNMKEDFVVDVKRSLSNKKIEVIANNWDFKPSWQSSQEQQLPRSASATAIKPIKKLTSMRSNSLHNKPLNGQVSGAVDVN